MSETETAKIEQNKEGLVRLFEDIGEEKKEISSKPGIFVSFIRNPFMLAGIGLTGYFMTKGVRAVSSGESLNLTKALQGRVLGQFGTLGVIIGTATWFFWRAPAQFTDKVNEDQAIMDQAVKNYRDAQARRNGEL
eukprot:sb/3474704/